MPETSFSGPFVIPFRELSRESLPVVGGKNASLGEMIQSLADAGVQVPDGFAVTADAFRLHLQRAGLVDEGIYNELDALDIEDVDALAKTARRIRERIRRAELPQEVAEETVKAYEEISRQYGEDLTDVAVRSSATAEDLPTASFAGQQETYLNIHGRQELLDAVRDCMASLFTDRAIVYREHRDFDHRQVALSVGVQKMVRSDLACAGVLFTLDTESGFRDVVMINGAYGLGETVVQGRVNPDEFWVHKPTLRDGYRSVIRRERGEKEVKLIYAEGGARTVREVSVPEKDRLRLVITDDEALQLARWGVAIEDHYLDDNGNPMPMDIEWAKDGRTGELFIVQARPETVHSQAGPPRFEVYQRRGTGNVLARGKAVGNKVGTGKARVVRSIDELGSFEKGEILVAPMTDPDWEPILARAGAVVTDHGGRTCHAAIVSRELDIPCVVGTGAATRDLADGTEVTVSCAEGDEGVVYEGVVEFDRQEIAAEELPEAAVPVMLNLGNPANAFFLGQMPTAGVGLTRIEFVVSSWIGIHPMALLRPERVRDLGVRAEIAERTNGYPSPAEFFIDRLSSGIAQVAASFYPRPILVRFSDFKTNEYAGLLGGSYFEPEEANPMIGFRGASRYYDDRYRDGFALECQAIRRVRETMGLTNVKVMVPFCRTINEGHLVLDELASNGLRSGEDGLEIYVMAEIPNNVFLADEFAEIFDGFSIGSNDLAQLVLGVDRDSEILSHIYDERDPGVKRAIEQIIQVAHSKGRPVGFCGQAPSDHPGFAEFLASLGIDSISVTPDALPSVLEHLAAQHAPVGGN